MLAIHRRPLIAHTAPAAAAIIAYCLRPGALIDHFHLPRRGSAFHLPRDAYARLRSCSTFARCLLD
jgi:hypothetical protein